MVAEVKRERLLMLLLLSLASMACLLGAFARPPADPQGGLMHQAVDLARVCCTSALVIVLLLGPGLVWRSRERGRRLRLGFLPLPGLALLILTGGVAWLLAGPVGAHRVSLLIQGPVLAWLLIELLRAGPQELLEGGEKRALLIVGSMLGFVLARTLWSLGPEGELFAGSVSRTLEVGSRPDSRIPFHVVQLIANGTAPYSELGSSYFSPYDFSSRGPLAGIASAPIVLLGGGRPPTSMPEQPWTPFDPEGFMAFRLAMMTFSATALLSLWTLTRRLSSERAAQLAILLAATTPFLIHELWFTWPKLLAASFVLLAAVCLIDARPLRAGLLVGFGYLMHPVALLSLPALGLIALWPLVGAGLKRPQIRQALWLLLGVVFFVVLWRVANGSHYTQEGFLDYLTEAGPNVQAAPWSDPLTWLGHRAQSLGNTVVPLLLPLAYADNPSINFFGGTSPAVVHLFFQYWNTLPFGVAILFFPLLLISLVRAFMQWRWPVFVAVVVPCLTFTIYWGSYLTGMLPEGLQTWVVTLFAVVAIQQWHNGFPWLRSRGLTAILALRAGEILAMATVPTLATRNLLIAERYQLVDTLAILGMIGFSICLAMLVLLSRPGRTSAWSVAAPAETQPGESPTGSRVPATP